MRSYERNGVTIEQCAECRGVFLDRGELEHLVDAESAHYEREAQGRGGEKPAKKSKKRSFLENILESVGEG
jgi:Zn-finger nucleic acid-binding protein